MNLTSYATYQPRDAGGRFVAKVVEDAVFLAVSEWAQDVLGTAQDLVPVDTGELRESGSVTVSKDGSRVSAAVEFSADHAAFVEYGTGIRGAASAGAGEGPYSSNWPGMAAQPYLRPAFERHRKEAQGITRETIASALK